MKGRRNTRKRGDTPKSQDNRPVSDLSASDVYVPASSSCRQACPTLTRFFEDQDAALSGRLIRTPRKTNTVAATRYVFERFNFHPTSVQVSTKIVKSSDSLSGESARSAMSSTYLVNLKPRDRSRMSSGFKIKSNK